MSPLYQQQSLERARGAVCCFGALVSKRFSRWRIKTNTHCETGGRNQEHSNILIFVDSVLCLSNFGFMKSSTNLKPRVGSDLLDLICSGQPF